MIQKSACLLPLRFVRHSLLHLLTPHSQSIVWLPSDAQETKPVGQISHQLMLFSLLILKAMLTWHINAPAWFVLRFKVPPLFRSKTATSSCLAQTCSQTIHSIHQTWWLTYAELHHSSWNCWTCPSLGHQHLLEGDISQHPPGYRHVTSISETSEHIRTCPCEAATCNGVRAKESREFTPESFCQQHKSDGREANQNIAAYTRKAFLIAATSPRAAAVRMELIRSFRRRIFSASIFCFIPNPTTALNAWSESAVSLSDSVSWSESATDVLMLVGFVRPWREEVPDLFEIELMDALECADMTDFDLWPAENILPDRWLKHTKVT